MRIHYVGSGRDFFFYEDDATSFYNAEDFLTLVESYLPWIHFIEL